MVDGTKKVCYSTDVNVKKKRAVGNIWNEEESHKDEKERGIQKGNKRNIARKKELKRENEI